MTNSKNNTFVKGALIIAIANLMVKVIGAFYKIPLDRFILGETGMGIYNSSYTIYNLLFVISTAGIPVAISKMIAETQASGRYTESKKILKVSQTMLILIGLVTFSLLYFFSKGFANAIGAPSTFLTMMVMSPSLFFVAIASSYRGFYQGQQNMLPTATSEVIEALCKLIFGISIAWYIKTITGELYMASAGAIAGVSIGTCLSLAYLFIYNKINIKKFRTENSVTKVSSARNILGRLFRIAIPITFGACVFSLTSVIDVATVHRSLSSIGYEELNRLSLFGYLGRATTMFAMPPTIIQAIAISVVPAIAAALAIKNKSDAIKNAKSALRITLLLNIPCTAILSGLSFGILKILYNDGNYNILLTLMGIAVVFVTIVQVSTAILQAWGKVWVPVVNMVIGGFVKIFINLWLVSQPDLNIIGAPIGTIICYLLVMTLNLIALKRVSGMKFEFADFILRPAFTLAVTLLTALFTYKYVFEFTKSDFISLVCGMAATGIVYIVTIFAIKTLKRDDILLLPKGDKLVEILEKFKVIS